MLRTARMEAIATGRRSSHGIATTRKTIKLGDGTPVNIPNINYRVPLPKRREGFRME